MWITRGRTLALAALVLLSPLGDQRPYAAQDIGQGEPPDLQSLRMVDFFNLFPNVGALVIWSDPNDLGIDVGLIGRCTGALIEPRVFLTAGHCVAPVAQAAPGSVSFIHTFVTFSPNAFDRSSWRRVARQVAHPSLPPCPPPEGCTFRGLDKGILDIGLVFLTEPVRGITPARLAGPNALERGAPGNALTVLPGYGDLDSLPGRRASADFRMGRLATDQNLAPSARRRRRVGQLVSPWRRLLWRFRDAHLSLQLGKESRG